MSARMKSRSRFLASGNLLWAKRVCKTIKKEGRVVNEAILKLGVFVWVNLKKFKRVFGFDFKGFDEMIVWMFLGLTVGGNL